MDAGVRPRRDLPLEAARRRHRDVGIAARIAPLQERVSESLWAAHLPPELGGQGIGQVQAGLMHEILGPPIRAAGFGNPAPDSGNSEILALAGTPEQKEQWLTRCSPATCQRVQA